MGYTDKELQEFKNHLEFTFDQYQEGIWYHRFKGRLKNSDNIHHYGEIVRGLRFIIDAWEIICENKIKDPEIIDSVKLQDISLKCINGEICDLGVLEAQNVSNYVFEIASVAMLIH